MNMPLFPWHGFCLFLSLFFPDSFLDFCFLVVLLVYVFQEESFAGGSQGASCVLYPHSL